MLEILYRDERMIAINKPPGLLVHPTRIAADVSESAMQMLRDQIEQWVYPVHRIDRKTSGVLLFALDKEIQVALSLLFKESCVLKKYIAIVRGYAEEEGEINYALKNLEGKTQEAISHYHTLKRSEIPLAHGKHNTSRYSLLELFPKTGRYHQLRKHMAHIFHPIIGDRPHGCNKQNKLFKSEFGLTEMMLHAESLSFEHPLTQEQVNIKASFHAEFIRMKRVLLLSD
jgi:tRNA pseudouridine65 synthase